MLTPTLLIFAIFAAAPYQHLTLSTLLHLDKAAGQAIKSRWGIDVASI